MVTHTHTRARGVAPFCVIGPAPRPYRGPQIANRKCHPIITRGNEFSLVLRKPTAAIPNVDPKSADVDPAALIRYRIELALIEFRVSAADGAAAVVRPLEMSAGPNLTVASWRAPPAVPRVIDLC